MPIRGISIAISRYQMKASDQNQCGTRNIQTGWHEEMIMMAEDEMLCCCEANYRTPAAMIRRLKRMVQYHSDQITWGISGTALDNKKRTADISGSDSTSTSVLGGFPLI